MSRLHKLESEAATWVNLDGDLANLHKHQQRLQNLIARATLDLSVVTEEIVTRQKGGEYGSANQAQPGQTTTV